MEIFTEQKEGKILQYTFVRYIVVFTSKLLEIYKKKFSNGNHNNYNANNSSNNNDDNDSYKKIIIIDKQIYKSFSFIQQLTHVCINKSTAVRKIGYEGNGHE